MNRASNTSSNPGFGRTPPMSLSRSEPRADIKTAKEDLERGLNAWMKDHTVESSVVERPPKSYFEFTRVSVSSDDKGLFVEVAARNENSAECLGVTPLVMQHVRSISEFRGYAVKADYEGNRANEARAAQFSSTFSYPFTR